MALLNCSKIGVRIIAIRQAFKLKAAQPHADFIFKFLGALHFDHRPRLRDAIALVALIGRAYVLIVEH